MANDYSEQINVLKNVIESVAGLPSLSVELLDMFKKHLTFDDPGLFSGKANRDRTERQLVLATIMWLLNQFNVAATSENTIGLRRSIYELQKEMLTASFLKQPWCFYEQVQRYVEFANRLMEMTSMESTKEERQINVFHLKEFDIETIVPIAKFDSIEITNWSTLNHFGMTNIKLLSHSVKMFSEYDPDLFIECCRCTLNAFRIFPLTIKITCLQYFSQVVENEIKLKKKVMTILEQLFQYIEVIDRESMKIWKDVNTINIQLAVDYEAALYKLFDNIELYLGDRNWMNCLQVVLKLLKNNLNEKPINDYTLRLVNLTKCLANHSVQNLNESILNQIIELITVNRQVVIIIPPKIIFRKFPGNINQRISGIIDGLLNSIKNKLKDTENVSDIHHLSIILRLVRSIRFEQPANTVPFYESINIASISSIIISIINRQPILIVNPIVQRLAVDLLSLSDRSVKEQPHFYPMVQIILWPFLLHSNTFLDVFPSFRQPPIKLITVELHHQAFTTFCQIDFRQFILKQDRLSAMLNKCLLFHIKSKKLVISFALRLLHYNLLSVDTFIGKLFVDDVPEFDPKQLKSIICFLAGNCTLTYRRVDVKLKTVDQETIDFDDYELTINCNQCDPIEYSVKVPNENRDLHTSAVDIIATRCFKYLNKTDDQTKLDLVTILPGLINHATDVSCQEVNYKVWMALLKDQTIRIRMSIARYFQFIVHGIMTSNLDDAKKDSMIVFLTIRLSEVMKNCLRVKDKPNQLSVLNLLAQFGNCKSITEKTLIKAFRMTLIFLVSVESMVCGQATHIAQTMCLRHKISPLYFLYWHREQIFDLLGGLLVEIFYRHKVGVAKALVFVSNVFGYKEPTKEFIPQNCNLILASLLPYIIQSNKIVEKLLDEVCAIVGKSRPTALLRSFAVIYTFLYMNEPKLPKEVADKCVHYVVQNTGKTLPELLEVFKKPNLNILVHYHKDPEFVMNVYRTIISRSVPTGSAEQAKQVTQIHEVSVSQVVDYLAGQLLGILIEFEKILTYELSGKHTQLETLLSLGEIIRLMGSKHITHVRYRIVAILQTVQNLPQIEIRLNCVQVWKIFIHTVDIQALGPLLSIIFVTLERFLDDPTTYQEIDGILNYLIITNGSILSVHMGDLFFLDETNASDDIKRFVGQQNKHLLSPGSDNESSDSLFLKQCQFYIKYIQVENLRVRWYSIKFLLKLLTNHQPELNRLILNHVNDENFNILLEQLMRDCKGSDRDLQLMAARCLGELSAIEPSLLQKSNLTLINQQNKFPLSVNSDDFAIMILSDLCMATQSQSDMKNIDAFHLAIQEILIVRGVNPKLQKNIAVWEAIPERLRPVMEPLLSSYLTNANALQHMSVYPLFGHESLRTCNAWAYEWAAQIIQMIDTDNIRHLLQSCKPCMKKDSRIQSLFLPYCLLHALQSVNDENRNRIINEFKTVFNRIMDKGDTNIIDKEPAKDRLFQMKSLEYFLIANLSNEAQSDPREKSTDKEEENHDIKCAKLALSQLDFLSRWIRSYNRYRSKPIEIKPEPIEQFISNFDTKHLANVNFRCGEFARSLLYLETYIEANPIQLQSELSFLAEIYAELADSDSLSGALGLKTSEPSLTEQILVNNVNDRLQESVVCFERMLQMGALELPENRTCVQAITQCYLGLDQPETALRVMQGLMSSATFRSDDDLLQQYDLLKETAEPLWQLSRWDELEELYVAKPHYRLSSDWGLRCGESLLKFRKGDLKLFDDEIEKSRLCILKELRLDGEEHNLYDKGYPLALKLHCISEMEKAFHLYQDIVDDKDMNITDRLNNIFSDWDARLELLQPISKTIEPILCLRRILLNEIPEMVVNRACFESDSGIRGNMTTMINNYIGKSWIRSTELARNAGKFQQAHMYILKADTYKVNGMFIEKAKLLWCKGEQANSFKVMDRGIQEIIADKTVKHLSPEQKRIYDEAKLLRATYNAESMNIDTNLNIKYFEEAAESESEKSFVLFAQYLDKVYAAMSPDQQISEKGMELQEQTMRIYGKSLSYGCNYIYQSLPRVLTIWMDFTAMQDKQHIEAYRRVSSNMTRMALKLARDLPAFIFFTAFSQIISRICHPNSQVWDVLKTIIIRLIKHFPQQSLWMMLSVFKSSYNNRLLRCNEIFSDHRLSNENFQKLIHDFNRLADHFIDLTNMELKKTSNTYNLELIYPNILRLLADKSFSPILLPTERVMQPILPTSSETFKSTDEFNAFPQNAVYIAGIRKDVTVLVSLQRPKKVTLIGSDGKEYTIMMKAKDDLRKDFRLMEFNSVVKKYLRENPDARQRRLNIRTYSVIPLNEECGIVEWVPNLNTMRRIILDYYNKEKLGLSKDDLRKYSTEVSKWPLDRKREHFLKVYLPKNPAVLHKWFKEQFVTPHNWYQARSEYIRSTAVTSMVGYILGLGDRHGENILFDQNNGNTVHVDFNCLFNKGETFEIPELVPFRLTHNMVHAMGPLGVEGLYRKCCEITMRVLQEQMPTLMSVLQPFVYDPLVTWNKLDQSNKPERTDPQALRNVSNIEHRLKGFVKVGGQRTHIPLSVEGVVNHCILSATDIDNLSCMYIGWAPYM